MKGESLERNSNHELLRLLSMYMIVLIHSGIYLGVFCTGTAWAFFNGLINGVCNIGVTCFILISGYYGVKFSVKKFVKMESMMIMYSLIETAVLWLGMPEKMQGGELLEQLAKSCLPFITRKYWFYSSYVCLMFFGGYIEKFIEKLEQEGFKKFLCLSLFLFSILPTCFYFELVPDNGKGLVQMVMVYMAGRYIRMYRDVRMPKKAGLLFLFLWMVNGISHELPVRVGAAYHHLCKDNSITNIMMAVILFYLFKDMEFRSKIVNRVAGYIFAVFALNYSFVSVVMERMARQESMRSLGGVWGFGLMCLIVFLIMCACLAVGAARELLFGRMDRRLGEAVSAVAEKIGRKAGGTMP